MRRNRFGFGLRDETSGELTHYLWCRTDDFEEGPHRIISMAYRSHEQILELLGVLKSLEGQIGQVTMYEPSDVHLQDVMSRPFAGLATSSEGKFATGIQSLFV